MICGESLRAISQGLLAGAMPASDLMRKSNQFRPILAASQGRNQTTEEFYSKIKLPVIASPKIDGIRVVTMDTPRPPTHQCEAYCRSLKLVPNEYIQREIALNCPPGLDGEVVTVDHDLFSAPKIRTFNQVQSDVMTHRGTPTFEYQIFDSCITSGFVYKRRLELLLDHMKNLPLFCKMVPQHHIETLSRLVEFEAECVAAGYEGICFRDPNSPYKWGRSTLREGYLIKMKRFITEEAVVIGMEEEMANTNPQSYSETGYAERSSHAANMVGKGRMGALVVRNDQGEFKIGTGFTAEQRVGLWGMRDHWIGKTVTFKHQPHGAKDLPRIPVYVGFRDERDL